MIKVFIGGSRRIARLNAQLRQRLDGIIDKRFPVLIGDANGADKAVQTYLHSRQYDQVEVFCMDGVCRNNVGNWKTRAIRAPMSASGRDYYSIKDEQMTKESSVGFMLWDGNSRGTLANISRLVDQQKKVVVYLAPVRQIQTVQTRDELAKLISHGSKRSPKPAKQHRYSCDRQPVGNGTPRLF